MKKFELLAPNTCCFSPKEVLSLLRVCRYFLEPLELIPDRETEIELDDIRFLYDLFYFLQEH